MRAYTENKKKQSRGAFNLHKTPHKLHKLTIKPEETEHLQEKQQKKRQNGCGKCTILERLLETG